MTFWLVNVALNRNPEYLLVYCDGIKNDSFNECNYLQ